MRRLSIDLEGGAQPIWNEDRIVAVVFNEEIYDYVELRRELIVATVEKSHYKRHCEAQRSKEVNHPHAWAR